MKTLFTAIACLLLTSLSFAQRPDGSITNNQIEYDSLKENPPIYSANEDQLQHRNYAQLFDADLAIYPNPAKHKITIKNSYEPLRALEIRDGNGKLIISETYTENASTTTEVDISLLPPGLYIVYLKFDPIPMAKKIVVCE